MPLADLDFLGYREWAHNLASGFNQTHFHRTLDTLCDDIDVILLGWSSIVPEEFYQSRTVLVLHPSPLPSYRGGSPLQHQILDGRQNSLVTLFKLDPAYSGIDAGPIFGRSYFSLRGDLAHILTDMSRAAAVLIHRYLVAKSLGEVTFIPQPIEGTVYKRRKPEESEITLKELESKSAEELYNKIRALQDPYPNAFIQTSKGKLYLTGAHYDDS